MPTRDASRTCWSGGAGQNGLASNCMRGTGPRPRATGATAPCALSWACWNRRARRTSSSPAMRARWLTRESLEEDASQTCRCAIGPCQVLRSTAGTVARLEGTSFLRCGGIPGRRSWRTHEASGADTRVTTPSRYPWKEMVGVCHLSDVTQKVGYEATHRGKKEEAEPLEIRFYRGR